MSSSKIKVSASSLKELETCSWKYYAGRYLKVPEVKNPKTLLGSVAHEIFEILWDTKYKKRISSLLKKDLESDEAILRLCIKKLKKYGLSNDPWLDDLKNCLMSGFKQDFYIKGHLERLRPEYEFKIITDNYECRGFIDSAAKMPATKKFPEGYLLIRDYKSQSKVFTKDELELSYQALIYQMALWEEFKLPSKVEFVLLRHGEIQSVDWAGESKLKGLVAYLEYISGYLNEFNEEIAKTNLAANNDEKKWLCGFAKSPGQLKKDGNLMWSCSCKFPSTYFVCVNKDGKIVSSAINKGDLKIGQGEIIKEMNYTGCPAFPKYQRGNDMF